MTLHLPFTYSWCRIKKDFLHYFHKPHLNLLVWIHMTKLMLTYYQKLDLTTNVTGWYCELSSWRKQFKHEWKKLAHTVITTPVNNKYRPDPVWWVCTCPLFVCSCFLICKHLVQAIQPVPPIFCLQVKRNHTVPFWKHPTLIPHNLIPNNTATTQIPSEYKHQEAEDSEKSDKEGSNDEDDEGEDDAVDTMAGKDINNGGAFHECFEGNIMTIQEFWKGLEYQIQFGDQWMLETLECEGLPSFLWMAKGCLEREKCINSARGPAPMVWEKGLETQYSIEQGLMLKMLTLNHPTMMPVDKALWSFR